VTVCGRGKQSWYVLQVLLFRPLQKIEIGW